MRKNPKWQPEFISRRHENNFAAKHSMIVSRLGQRSCQTFDKFEFVSILGHVIQLRIYLQLIGYMNWDLRSTLLMKLYSWMIWNLYIGPEKKFQSILQVHWCTQAEQACHRENPVLHLVKYICKLGIATVAQITQVQMQLPFHFFKPSFWGLWTSSIAALKITFVFKQIYVFPIVDF
jgi:hypothetical protein